MESVPLIPLLTMKMRPELAGGESRDEAKGSTQTYLIGRETIWFRIFFIISLSLFQFEVEGEAA